MFNSTKLTDSPRIYKTSPHSTMNDTTVGASRSFIPPRITSTPLVKRESIFATPPKPHILSPRRYSLSEIATPPRSNRKDPSRMNLYLNSTGPLLASTKYNVNVSTYEDTKSPGLAGRIVQYNEETEREKERQQRPSIQHSKYSSLGLFPIVHLFKRELPTLEPKPRRVTVRIASPEYSRHHTQEYNRKLLEGIVKPSSVVNSNRHFPHPGSETTSTRSVLDALKEISRKRIHANEEYELKEDTGKRIRTENFNGTDSNKRLRDDSPLLETSPSKPVSKRICVYDEYAASCSSMDFSFKNPDMSGSKRKSISISTLTENPKDSKQVKLINAETQTIVDEVNQMSEPKESPIADINQNENQTDDDKSVKKRESPIKIFDDAPLERIRKNRLAALMGSLTGKDPVLAPKPDYETALNSTSNDSEQPKSSTDVSKLVEKPLVSILSTPTKRASPNKSDKHVHFSIPESTSQTNVSSTSITSLTVTQSSTEVVAPTNASDLKSTLVSSEGNSKLETPAPPSSPVNINPSHNDNTSAVPVITFGSGSNISSSTSLVSKESSTLSLGTKASAIVSTPAFQFNVNKPANSLPLAGAMSNTTSSGFKPPTNQITFGASTVAPPFSTSSPPKLGGFKFDLTKSSEAAATAVATAQSIAINTTTTNSSTPTFNFGNTSQNSATNVSKPLFQNINVTPLSTSAAVPSEGFSFIAKNVVSNNAPISSSTTSASLTTTTPALSFGLPPTNFSAAPSFKFGTGNLDSKAAVANFGISTTKSITFGSPVATTSAIAYGTNATSTAPGSLESGASTISTLAFGSGNPVSSPTSFGSSALTTSTPTFGLNAPITSSLPFGSGASTTTSQGFGSSKPTFTFGPSNTATTVGFGIPATTSAIISFGTPTTTATSGFGSASAQSGFGTNSTTSSLTISSPATAANTGFGTSAPAPMFGANKLTSPFDMSTTAPAFGSASAANPSPFTKTMGQGGAQSSFGTPTTTISFGNVNAFGAATATTASSVFGGTVNSSGFGNKTTSFGTPSTTTNVFGGAPNAQPSGFGETNSKPAFGSSTSSPFGNVPATTTAPTFGVGTTPSFTFGAKTTATTTYAANAFGVPTTASTGFGTSTTPAFGTSNTFGSTTSNFGPNNVFGATTTPAFGTTTTTVTQSGGFGTTNSSSFGASSGAFGATGKSPSGFGNTTTAAFGANAPAFGPSAQTTGFGSTNNAPGFGANSVNSAFVKPQPAAQNNFGTTPNAFGSSNSFGGTQPQAPPSFGATNPPTTQAGVFSFGSGAAAKTSGVFSFGGTAPDPPKHSFNFTGGNTMTPNFGSSSTLSFGSTGTPSFGAAGPSQFNAPQPAPPGMFSIGSGSTSTGRTRTQLKAKRRT